MRYLAHSPFGYGWEGNYWWLARFMWLVVMGGLVALTVILALRLAGRLPAGGGTPGVQRTSFDPAVNELRVRYARGEVGRDEYLRAASDLGAPGPPPEPPSPPPAA